MTQSASATFGDDVEFLKRHTELVVLANSDGPANVAVAPAWQGRVMTSSAAGDAGFSFGWINRELISSRKLQEHINVFGGEDRMWLGPEGGQFSIFFAKGAKFELGDWYTPKAIDTMPWPVKSQSSDRVKVAARFAVTNFSDTQFDVQTEREVRVLPSGGAWRMLGLDPVPGASLVAYESDNRLTNKGSTAWTKDSGLLSIWMLGMFKPSPQTTIVVPIRRGSEAELGVKVTSDYFGEIPPDRLKLTEDAVFFRGDGRLRSKVGVNPRRSKAILGSYDGVHEVLTIVQFTQPAGVTDYVNSLWKIQDNPYVGDASNSYNDGPPTADAKALGAFYELESSSPAAALSPGQTLVHLHKTSNLMGSPEVLDRIARRVLDVSIGEMQTALP
jgi:hypothetical protein